MEEGAGAEEAGEEVGLRRQRGVKVQIAFNRKVVYISAVSQRKSFETFAAKGYGKVRAEILGLLDGYTEQEAMALLESARAEIALRDAWIIRDNPTCQLRKKHRLKQVLRSISDTGPSRENQSSIACHG